MKEYVSPSRRLLLRGDAGVFATAVTSGLAGGTEVPRRGGGGGSSAVENWAVVPGEIVDRWSIRSLSQRNDAIRDAEEGLAAVYYHNVEEYYQRRFGTG